MLHERLSEIERKLEKTNYELKKLINDLGVLKINSAKKIDIDRIIPRIERILSDNHIKIWD